MMMMMTMTTEIIMTMITHIIINLTNSSINRILLILEITEIYCINLHVAINYDFSYKLQNVIFTKVCKCSTWQTYGTFDMKTKKNDNKHLTEITSLI